MLSYAEEILLLSLDERTGAIKPLPIQALRYALAGALLVELAMSDRIDTDLDGLEVVSSTPTGNPLLDDVLRRLGNHGAKRPTTEWLETLAWEIPDLQGQILDGLVAKGVLRIEDQRILWVIAKRRYPIQDDREIKAMHTRLRELILSDTIPDPDEAVLIALVDACQLFDELFSADELEHVRARIANLAKLDLIGREVTHSIREISRAIAQSMMAVT